MANKEKRELVVIGGGPGGYAAAFHAADKGMQTTLIDPEENPGGVCLYRGCIPSKTLLHMAKVVHEAAGLAKSGIKFGAPHIDARAVRAFKVRTDHTAGSSLASLGSVPCATSKPSHVPPMSVSISNGVLLAAISSPSFKPSPSVSATNGSVP